MDTPTAFSLACGVIQIVDFSIKTLAKCKQILKEGSFSEHEELKDLTRHLINVRAEIELPEANQSARVLTTLDQSLLDVAGQCSRTADQLVQKLESLEIEGPRKRRQAISKTIKSLWEKGEIQGIQQRLDGYRNTLNTQILVSLRYDFIVVTPIHYSLNMLTDPSADNSSIQSLCQTVRNTKIFSTSSTGSLNWREVSKTLTISPEMKTKRLESTSMTDFKSTRHV